MHMHERRAGAQWCGTDVRSLEWKPDEGFEVKDVGVVQDASFVIFTSKNHEHGTNLYDALPASTRLETTKIDIHEISLELTKHIHSFEILHTSSGNRITT